MRHIKKSRPDRVIPFLPSGKKRQFRPVKDGPFGKNAETGAGTRENEGEYCSE
jgi:hypothetical protein